MSDPYGPTTPSKVVHLFPGQGDFSLSPLVRLLPDAGTLARSVAEVFEEADSVAAEFDVVPIGPRLLGARPPSAGGLAAEAPGTVQLALFGVSLAVHRALEADGCRADRLLAVSFGEIPALTAAGCCSVADGARLACRLGQLLTGHGGGMTLLAAGLSATRRLLDVGGAGAASVVVACVNHEAETVVSGPLDGLAVVERLAARAGVEARRLRLPFMSHHPELAREAGAFAHYARRLRLTAPSRPVHSVVAGRAYRPQDDLPRALSACLVRSFSLPAVLGAALSGAGPVVEAGTGGSLANSVRVIDPGRRASAPVAEGRWPGATADRTPPPACAPRAGGPPKRGPAAGPGPGRKRFPATTVTGRRA
ncbi:ACP S-malonyltransferase [Kitasatospora viridis]|uniref:Malonyl CoA-acyl carrier protein transacylase n=1 Tax=Kitasatospora viridis TaxID=281105 RepID=A0A561TVB2_9ACTN|nr:acyltransferase domain-containing protein [Kitasatospora viridis]TWF91050.1 malonyl CoA-acyl carrier protein transacylase [Kitasatospora viridis]